MKIAKFSKSIPFLVFGALVLLSSCGDNETILGEQLSTPDPDAQYEVTGPEIETPDGVQTYGNAHHLLWPFLEVFEKEAKDRQVYGADIHTANLTIEIAELIDPALSEYTSGSNTLIIDKTFWKDATDGEKELILFNALGNNFLGKAFKDDETSNGICMSLLRSPSATCIDNYNANTRTVFLDDLFEGL